MESRAQKENYRSKGPEEDLTTLTKIFKAEKLGPSTRYEAAIPRDITMCRIKTYIQSKVKTREGENIMGGGPAEVQTKGKKNISAAHLAGIKAMVEEVASDSKPGPEKLSEKQSPLNGISIEDCVDYLKRHYLPSHGGAGMEASNSQVKKDNEANYKRWKSYLTNGLNLCLFGIGSKSELLDHFVETEFKDCLRLKIKGFNSSVKVENILMKLLNILEPFGDLRSQAELNKVIGAKRPNLNAVVKILNQHCANFEQFGFHLILIFHELDGKHFRELQQHSILSRLVKKSGIKLVASMSSCQFPTLVGKDIWMDYNFVMEPVHTHLPNEFELVSDEVAWYNKQQSKSTEAMKVIYSALTQTQKEILKVLARVVSESASGQVSMAGLYDACMDELLVNNESQLTEMLKEAIAHSVAVVF